MKKICGGFLSVILLGGCRDEEPHPFDADEELEEYDPRGGKKGRIQGRLSRWKKKKGKNFSKQSRKHRIM